MLILFGRSRLYKLEAFLLSTFAAKADGLFSVAPSARLSIFSLT